MTDAQSKLPGLPQAGLLHETNFNPLLANALRRKRKAWREDPQTVTVERTQVVEGARRERPDLLVFAPDAYPVAIETEWGDPALAVWLNSTLGNLLRTCYAQTTQQGRATMQVKAIADSPSPISPLTPRRESMRGASRKSGSRNWRSWNSSRSPTPSATPTGDGSTLRLWICSGWAATPTRPARSTT